jgi:hypothetical protein
MSEPRLAVPMAVAVEGFQQSMSDRHNHNAASATRENPIVRWPSNAIRRDNDTNDVEDRERLRITREQIFSMLQFVVWVARAIPGMGARDVDRVMAKVVMAEVERAGLVSSMSGGSAP